ncbi:hypothetical protein BpHYR1_036810 [Brachionus plicatilis]|uniref:Uncharacterized protein n=1 Tax=Brachionus plicatilis TaxID=10195 RepID=A0A3M7SI77_BRAPC|nr:hypothetical protein BpHYR1_036810 [Brachionus plicatilis]
MRTTRNKFVICKTYTHQDFTKTRNNYMSFSSAQIKQINNFRSLEDTKKCLDREFEGNNWIYFCLFFALNKHSLA